MKYGSMYLSRWILYSYELYNEYKETFSLLSVQVGEIHLRNHYTSCLSVQVQQKEPGNGRSLAIFTCNVSSCHSSTEELLH